MKWNMTHIGTLKDFYDKYLKTHSSEKGELGITDEAWNLLVLDMQKKFPKGNFEISSCQIAFSPYWAK